MAAISTLLLAVLKSGDKILTQGNLYGGTTELFLKIMQPLGIEVVMINLKDLNLVEETIKADPKIKMLYFETPANPTLSCLDINSLSQISKKNNIFSVVDNTFCTPFLTQPLRLGADFVVHSTTRYLNGHGNSIAGAVIGSDLELMKTKVWQAMKLLGTNCNPFDAWLTHNGMKTLSLRMNAHSSNALTIARWLEEQPEVEQVNYPFLPSFSDFSLAKKQMKAGGGMLSFELKGGLQKGINCMNKLRFCTLAPTLGDVDTLVLHPATMSHLNISKEIRERNGITDGLIRLSVGIENVGDIINDLAQAIAE